jgi:hypothetical protein
MDNQARLMVELTFCSASFDIDMTAMDGELSGN